MKKNMQINQSGRVQLIMVVIILILFGGILYWWFGIKGEEINNNQKLTPITVQLKWLHQAQFAGNYVAEQKGFYKERGMDVTLKPFDYTISQINEVVEKRAEFGIAGADELLIARAKGHNLKALAVIYQENPVVAYALKSSGIKTPKDFINKRVGIQENSNVEFLIRAMLADQGINVETDLTLVPVGYDPKMLLTNQVDVSSGYLINEPIQAETAGHPINIISPSDYGVNLYADVLFTTEELIENNPELVQNFVTATLEGWEYALDNKEEALEYVLMYKDPNNEALNYEHQSKLLENSVPLIKPTLGTTIGQMNYERWIETYKLLRKLGIVEKELDITEAYTLEFLGFNDY